MKLKKNERTKALRMIDGWSESYIAELEFYKDVENEFIAFSEEVIDFSDKQKIQLMIETLRDAGREMHILLRMRELTLNLRSDSKQIAKLDRLITRFFQSRQLYLGHWEAAEEIITYIMAYLNSNR